MAMMSSDVCYCVFVFLYLMCKNFEKTKKQCQTTSHQLMFYIANTNIASLVVWFFLIAVILFQNKYAEHDSHLRDSSPKNVGFY